MKKKHPGGRPSEMTPEAIKKLEEVFAIDGTVQEACFYADITPTTYYNWLEKKPELVERFEALRNRPVLKARQTVVQSLNTPAGAQWYLQRKRKTEFSERTEVTGADGAAIKVEVSERIKELAKKLNG
jgi:hypothetical protein